MHKGHLVTGTITATGAAINVPLGFVPERVRLVNQTRLSRLEWFNSMANGSGIKDRVQAVNEGGTATYNIGPVAITTGGISPFDGNATTAAGFTLGADADLNVNGDTIRYEAVSADS